MVNCTTCGTPLATGSQFCGACGSAATPQTPVQPSPSSPAPPPWYRTGTGALGIGMTLVATAIVTVAFIVSSSDDNGTVARPATGETTSPSPETTVTTSEGAQETTSTSEAGVVETTAASTPGTTAVPTTTGETGFSETFQGAFMDAFVNGGNRAFCRCALNRLEAMYTEAELAAVLEGTAAVPTDFSDASIPCFDELPPTAPLPAFALPNTCTIEAWDVVVAYPSDWSVDETFGPCDSYVPDNDPSNTPILFTIDDTTTFDEVSAARGDPENTFTSASRTYAVWVGEIGGTWWTDFFAPLRPDVADGPVVWFALASDGEEDYLTVAWMMIRGLQVLPSTP